MNELLLVPMLFYLACVLMLIGQGEGDRLFVPLAWVFIVGRAASRLAAVRRRQ